MIKSFAPSADEFQVNTHFEGDQQEQTVTALKNGGFMVAWASDGQDGSDWGIYAQVFDASGTPVGDEFRVNTNTDDRQDDPTMTTLADGNVVITWFSLDQDGDRSGTYGQLLSPEGVALGGEFQINTYTDDHQLRPEVTALEDGGFVVVWTSLGQDGSGLGIYGQRFNADGTPDGGEFQVNTTTSNSQDRQSVTALPDGEFIVAWASWLQEGNNGYEVYAQRFDSDGDPVGVETRINTTITENQSHPELATLEDGGYVVIWNSFGHDGYRGGIYGQRFDANGVAVGTEFLVNTITDGDQANAQIVALTDGGFLVMWNTELQDGGLTEVAAQQFDANGDPVGSEFIINTERSGYQSRPAAAQLNDGSVVVVWDSDGQDGDGRGVFARVLLEQIEGTEANDLIYGTQENDLIFGHGGRDVLIGGEGNDILMGGADKDQLYGQQGDDTLYGEAGGDKLEGHDGNDTLFGGTGKDVLKGGAGDDILQGDTGRDVQYGGTGADTFVFTDASDSTNGSQADVIQDFEVGIDKIDLQALALDATAITIVDGANTTVFIDIDDDGIDDMRIDLTNVSGVTSDDFLF